MKSSCVPSKGVTVKHSIYWQFAVPSSSTSHRREERVGRNVSKKNQFIFVIARMERVARGSALCASCGCHFLESIALEKNLRDF
jgi:hypothetical protein